MLHFGYQAGLFALKCKIGRQVANVRRTANQRFGIALGMELQQYLQPSRLIDSQHPKVQEQAKAITQNLETDISKAVALHNFVRDKIYFGWAWKFSNYKASQVLQDGVGFCQTKTVLFVALLRSLGIPARPMYCEISTAVLNGFTIPGPFVDHSYAEVYLGGKWLQVDSYVIDKPLAEKALSKLEASNEDYGFGVVTKRAGGTIEWDGKCNAFIQYVEAAPQWYKGKVYGEYADPADFYKRNKGATNGGASQWLFPLFVGLINGQVAAFRKGKENAPAK